MTMDRVLGLALSPFYVLGKYKNVALFLLILVISLSPRIHIGTLEYGKLFDLRYEDFFIIILALSWFMYAQFTHQNLYVSPIGSYILLYLLLALISTYIGLFMGWIEPVRAFFYYMKEVEYFLFFLIVLNFVNSDKDFNTAVIAILIGGVVSGCDVLYQLASGNTGWQRVGFRYYGVSYIGESTPFVAGAYFSMVFFLSLAFLRTNSGKIIKIISVFCISTAIIGIIGSMTRTIAAAAAIVFLIYLYFVFCEKGRKAKKLLFIVVMVAFLVFMSVIIYKHLKEVSLPVERLTNLQNVSEVYRVKRWEEVFVYYLSLFFKNPVMGMGKSITGTGSELVGTSLGEAHNQYLRILVEMGVIGLTVFLLVIYRILKIAYRIYQSSNPFQKAIGETCFLFTLVLLLSSFTTDAFIPVKTGELYWIIVALTMVAYKWNRKISA